MIYKIILLLSIFTIAYGNNNSIINSTLNTKQSEIELVTLNKSMNESKTTPTTNKRSTIEEIFDDNKEICVKETCIPIYGLIIIIVCILIILCVCYCCCC